MREKKMGDLGAVAPKKSDTASQEQRAFDAVLLRLSQFKHRRGIRYDLADFLTACACFDHPERRLPPVIHVAGTNGKGSTVAYLATGFRAMGLRVGTYTSPHMHSYCERIADDEGPIPAFVFCALADHVMAELSPDLAERITEFEVLTLMAFLYFVGEFTVPSECELSQDAAFDIVIIETGLGGRLDATNVVRPIASVITPIGLDHQDILGETLSKIAAEKAGIIKPGVPVFTAVQDPEAAAMLSATAEKNKAVLQVIPPWDKLPKSFVMQGDYQRQNAALAYAVVAGFGGASPQKQTLSLQSQESEMGSKGLRPLDPIEVLAPAMVWGRFTVLHVAGRRVIIDGAHNGHGLRGLQVSLRAHGVLRPTLWMGILKNRPLSDMLRPWEGWASALWYTDFSPGTSHAFADVAALGLALPCRERPLPETVAIFEAMVSALPEGGDLVITGSLYFLAGVYRGVGQR